MPHAVLLLAAPQLGFQGVVEYMANPILPLLLSVLDLLLFFPLFIVGSSLLLFSSLDSSLLFPLTLSPSERSQTDSSCRPAHGTQRGRCLPAALPSKVSGTRSPVWSDPCPRPPFPSRKMALRNGSQDAEAAGAVLLAGKGP